MDIRRMYVKEDGIVVNRYGSEIVVIFRDSIYNQGGRGHWAVYYTSPRSFVITFSYSWAQQP